MFQQKENYTLFSSAFCLKILFAFRSRTRSEMQKTRIRQLIIILSLNSTNKHNHLSVLCYGSLLCYITNVMIQTWI